MSVNACIYDADHALVGCITDSAVKRFREEFEDLKARYFGGFATPILGIMEKTLVCSEDKMSADFLNCLKLVSRKYRDSLPEEFTQEVSRAYHALVRHCCSQEVYDEVLEATINEFREAGFDYVGANMQSSHLDEYVFEYRHVKIYIKMRERQDLYRIWEGKGEAGTRVSVTYNADEYTEMLAGTPTEIAESAIEFIESLLQENMEDECILDNLLGAIEALLCLK